MFHRSLNASALLSGVSAIALAVAGAASHAVAQVTQDVELDPITVVSIQPVQRGMTRVGAGDGHLIDSLLQR